MMEHTVLADTLNYNLYTSNSYVQIWGDGNHGTATVNLTKIRSNTPPVIVYGKIFPLQDVSPGRYMEQLVVTISY
jgi:spore coat protein U-like protein